MFRYTDRSEYYSNETSGHVSAYSNCVWECWQPVQQRDFIISSFDWTGFDYKGLCYICLYIYIFYDIIIVICCNDITVNQHHIIGQI